MKMSRLNRILENNPLCSLTTHNILGSGGSDSAPPIIIDDPPATPPPMA